MATMTDQLQQQETIRRLTNLALNRTLYSSERSLMSWMRTTVSLYTFGFTITKFMDYLGNQANDSEYAAGLERLGLVLIVIGCVALILALIEHTKRVRTMRRLGLGDRSPLRLPIIGAALLLTIGLATIIDLIPTTTT